MENRPLISIITVTYNAADVIRHTVKSLQDQTFNDFEYLVIDGDSKDETLQVIGKNPVPNTHIISEPDQGLYDAMNKGLRLAKGKYVLFLNAGDAFHSPETLANYAEKAMQGKDIIYGDTIIVNTQGDCLGPRHLHVPERLSKKSFADGMLICHQAFMVKKELTPEYNLAYRFSADYDWCIKCISNGDPNNFVNLQEVTIDYLSNGLTDNNKWKSLKERFKIMVRHYGLPTTVEKHFGFIFRALRRGSI